MSITATYSSATVFTVTGNQTTLFTVGRRVRANCQGDGYKYGTIASSSYSSSTTVTFATGSDSLTANLLNVDVGIVNPAAAGSQPVHSHGSLIDGGYLPSLRLASSSGGLLEDNQASPSGTRPMGYGGYFYATRVYNAYLNDFADFVELAPFQKMLPGMAYFRYGRFARLCNRACQKGIIGICSDTFGISVGENKELNQIPIAVAGFALAFCEKAYPAGTPLMTTRRGTLKRMSWWRKILFSERIVAIYQFKETQPMWGPQDHRVAVCGRHWVKVV